MATYSLEFFSNKNYIKKYIDFLIDRENIDAKTALYKDEIKISTTQDEKLLELLGSKLPLSVFMGEFSSCDDFSGERVYVDEGRVELSICPNCLEELFDKNSTSYLDYKKCCELCGSEEFCSDSLELAVTGSDIDGLQSEDMYKKIADMFLQKGSLFFNGIYGDMTLFSEYEEGCTYAFTLNPEDVKEQFFISNEELVLLNALERPIVSLQTKPGSILAESGVPYFYLSVANESLLYILLYFMKKVGVGFVYAKNGKFSDLEVTIKGTTGKRRESLKMGVNGKNRYIIDGDRALAPIRITIKDTQDKLSVFGKWGALLSEEIVYADRLDRLSMIGVDKVITDLNSPANISHANTVKIPKDDASARAVAIFEEKKSFMNCYLSLENPDSALGLYVKGRYRRVLEVASIPFSSETIFSGLTKSAKVPEKLLENYKNSFEEEFGMCEGILCDKQRFSSSLKSIFGVLGVFISPLGGLDSAYERVYHSALFFNGESGVKIDMSVVRINDKYMFDWQKSLASILSFKLAGVHKDMLSYSLFESFSDFINENIIELKKQSGLDELYLNGSFIANSIFTKRVLKHAGATYTPHISRKLPLEGVSLALGGLDV